MTYKTILVHADGSRHADARLRYAAAIARAQGGTLLGAAFTGVSRAVFPEGFDVRPDTLSASYFEPLAANARRALDACAAVAHEFGVPCEQRLVSDQPDDGLAQLARFADVVVVSQDDPDEAPAGSVVRIPDYVILNCARPVLVVPRCGAPAAMPARVLLAWNGSKEAAFALAAALPLLGGAGAVTVADLAGTAQAAYQAQLDEVQGWLARHGVHADTLRAPAGPDHGRALLDVARERGCDLLVMGCYGHGRLRELCLGGASRTVLAEAAIPVLLAH